METKYLLKQKKDRERERLERPSSSVLQIESVGELRQKMKPLFDVALSTSGPS